MCYLCMSGGAQLWRWTLLVLCVVEGERMEVHDDGAGGRAVEAAVELVHHLDERGFRDLDGADGGLARLPMLLRAELPS